MGYKEGRLGVYKMYSESKKCSHRNLTELPSEAMKQPLWRHWNHCELEHCHTIDLVASCDCDLG